MTTLELLAMMAAQLAAGGKSVPGAVADAREILDELRRQEPDVFRAHDRAAVTDALRRARERST